MAPNCIIFNWGTMEFRYVSAWVLIIIENLQVYLMGNMYSPNANAHCTCHAVKLCFKGTKDALYPRSPTSYIMLSAISLKKNEVQQLQNHNSVTTASFVKTMQAMKNKSLAFIYFCDISFAIILSVTLLKPSTTFSHKVQGPLYSQHLYVALTVVATVHIGKSME
jgi:hypothetical protein